MLVGLRLMQKVGHMRKIFAIILMFMFVTGGFFSSLLPVVAQDVNVSKTSHKHSSSHHQKKIHDEDGPAKHCIEKCKKQVILSSPRREEKVHGNLQSGFLLQLALSRLFESFPTNTHVSEFPQRSLRFIASDVLLTSGRIRV